MLLVVTSVLFVLAGWSAVAYLTAQPYLVPAPMQALDAVAQRSDLVRSHVLHTATVIVAGNIAALLACVLTYVASREFFDRGWRLADLYGAVPAIVFGPLLILCSGLGMLTQLVGSFLAAILTGLPTVGAAFAGVLDKSDHVLRTCFVTWLRATMQPTIGTTIALEYLTGQTGIGGLMVVSLATLDAPLVYGLSFVTVTGTVSLQAIIASLDDERLERSISI